MTKRSPKLYVMDILDSIGFISNYSKGVSYSDFLKDIKLQDAILRRFEIIGEAGRNLANLLEGRYPNIPWKKMIAMRNVAAHEYFGIDLEVIWKTIKEDFPQLKKEIEQVLQDIENTSS